jgi:hypothetical protein
MHILSIDLLLKDEHSADSVYQECLRQCFPGNFELLTSENYQGATPRSEKILKPITGKSLISKFIALLKNSVTVFRKIKSNKQEKLAVVFQAFFGFELLMTIVFVLLLKLTRSQKQIAIALILRFELSRVQKILFPILFKITSTNPKVILLTDTIELQNLHESILKRKPVLVPIPHTFTCSNLSHRDSDLRIGFPGFPRIEKGIDSIAGIIDATSDCNIKYLLQNWTLYKAAFSSHENVNLAFETATRSDYRNYVCACDLVILPYDQRQYKNRSSGIFVESIACGKIVLVPKGTWMANQLAKAGLEYFIIQNFEDIDEVRSKILKISENFENTCRVFKKKISKISDHHNITSFTKVVRDAFLLENPC